MKLAENVKELYTTLSKGKEIEYCIGNTFSNNSWKYWKPVLKKVTQMIQVKFN